MVLEKIHNKSLYLEFIRGVNTIISETLTTQSLIPMNTRMQTLPLGAFSNNVPTNPQD
jgi:hypothetical protein